MSITTDPTDPRLGRGYDDKPVQQNEVYLVLSEEERSKGFVRPLRDTYRHTGRKVCGKPVSWSSTPGVVCADRPGHPGDCDTTAIDPKELEKQKGCNQTTSISWAIAETYARNPKFYGSTYCVECQMHRPLAEFTWLDGSQVGS